MRQHEVTQFVVRIKNDQYPLLWEVRKIYNSHPEASAAKHQLIRVIDESGEDYLYPADYFVPIKLPQLSFKHSRYRSKLRRCGRLPRRRSSLRAGREQCGTRGHRGRAESKSYAKGAVPGQACKRKLKTAIRPTFQERGPMITDWAARSG